MALVCDVAALCGKKELGQLAQLPAPAAEELEGLWADLAGADGARAYRAVRRLAAAGPRGAAFLVGRLKGGPAPEEGRIARLVASLDSDDFATREKASRRLAEWGERAVPGVRKRLDKAESEEVRKRAHVFLDRFDPATLKPERLRRLRAVELLEGIATPAAREVLSGLAKGAAEAPLSREAAAALERLRRQGRTQAK